MDIGSIHFPHSPVLALAPMAGYTDAAFRTLIAARGADLVFSELSSAAALSRANSGQRTSPRATDAIIQVGEGAVTGIQIFGNKPEEVRQAVLGLRARMESGECKAQLIDINFGCPAPKVVRNGCGSALLQDEKKVKEIAETAVKAAGGAGEDIPVTAKIRLGYKTKNNTLIATTLEKAGIATITVHARTAAQKFSGKADWEGIGEVVRAVSIPVIGNGDVKRPEDVKRMVDSTGCAGVMVGRAMLANPMLFSQARQFLLHGKYTETTWEDKTDFLSQYVALMPQYELSFHHAKELAMQLACGFRCSAKMRGELMMAKDGEELVGLMEKRETRE